jgi:hypothetical protein
MRGLAISSPAPSRGRGTAGGGRGGDRQCGASSLAPSTMLRMVPLPRFVSLAGEEC